MSARQALLRAAKQLLSERGYEATSPRDIQRASGVGQGSFYHHFESKANLASAALAELQQEMCAEFDALDDDGDLAVTYLTADRDALAGCRIGRLTMESALTDDRLREPVAGYFTHVRGRLTEHFRSLETDVDPAQLADLVVAAVQGGYVLARAADDPGVQRSALDALVALLQRTDSTTEETRP